MQFMVVSKCKGTKFFQNEKKNLTFHLLRINSVSTPYQRPINSHSVSVNFNLKPIHCVAENNALRLSTFSGKVLTISVKVVNLLRICGESQLK